MKSLHAMHAFVCVRLNGCELRKESHDIGISIVTKGSHGYFNAQSTFCFLTTHLIAKHHKNTETKTKNPQAFPIQLNHKPSTKPLAFRKYSFVVVCFSNIRQCRWWNDSEPDSSGPKWMAEQMNATKANNRHCPNRNGSATSMLNEWFKYSKHTHRCVLGVCVSVRMSPDTNKRNMFLILISLNKVECWNETNRNENNDSWRRLEEDWIVGVWNMFCVFFVICGMDVTHRPGFAGCWEDAQDKCKRHSWWFFPLELESFRIESKNKSARPKQLPS